MNPSEYRSSLTEAAGSADEFRWRQAELIRAAHDEELPDWLMDACHILKRAPTTVRAYRRAAEFRHKLGRHAPKLALEWYVIAGSYLERADPEELCDMLAQACDEGELYEDFRDQLRTRYGAPATDYPRSLQRMADRLWSWYDAAPVASQPHIKAAVDELKQAKEKAGQ